MSDDSDAPPRGTVEPTTTRLPYPRYAPTPMPVPEVEDTRTTSWSWALVWAFVAIVITHTWAMARLRADIQTILQYQEEQAQQAMQSTPIQWRIVPN